MHQSPPSSRAARSIAAARLCAPVSRRTPCSRRRRMNTSRPSPSPGQGSDAQGVLQARPQRVAGLPIGRVHRQPAHLGRRAHPVAGARFINAPP
ncbi:MAG: hypothetical protein MZV63_40225 [Marinilabiliales bacterium]|nr:hypothetical protein [Marinilabiliales bacterium]